MSRMGHEVVDMDSLAGVGVLLFEPDSLLQPFSPADLARVLDAALRPQLTV